MKTTREKFLQAIEQCQLKRIISLVKQGYNIHLQSTPAQNLLVHILQQQHEDSNEILRKKYSHMFQFFITKYNLDIHSLDNCGKNLFNWAANLNCTQEALYLLQSSPGDLDILLRDQTGSCSLHYAVEHGNEILVHAIVNYLLRYRLRFDIRDAHNNTPEDLARKLGYEKIAHFLGEACRSTVFFSREIPDQVPRTAKSKSNTSSEYWNLIESKIDRAKDFEDWKTVAALRAFRKNSKEKRIHRLPNPVPHHIRRTSTAATSPAKLLSIPQSVQMLRLLEPQLSPSYRQPFVPIYQQASPNINTPASRRTSSLQRKMSHVSSQRLSSVLSQRKRDSDLSEICVSGLPDVQNHVAMPAVHRSNRPSIVTTN